MDHVIIRKLEHLTGSVQRPAIGYAVETRDRPGPAHKKGAFEDDRVWLQLHGGLVVAKARIELCWVGEYASVAEIRARTRDSAIHDVDDFWRGRPHFGYAAVASVVHDVWIDPFWGGPRSYGYEWVLLDSDSKQKTWTEPKEPPRSKDDLLGKFQEWRG